MVLLPHHPFFDSRDDTHHDTHDDNTTQHNTRHDTHDDDSHFEFTNRTTHSPPTPPFSPDARARARRTRAREPSTFTPRSRTIRTSADGEPSWPIAMH